MKTNARRFLSHDRYARYGFRNSNNTVGHRERGSSIPEVPRERRGIDSNFHVANCVCRWRWIPDANWRAGSFKHTSRRAVNNVPVQESVGRSWKDAACTAAGFYVFFGYAKSSRERKRETVGKNQGEKSDGQKETYRGSRSESNRTSENKRKEDGKKEQRTETESREKIEEKEVQEIKENKRG